MPAVASKAGIATHVLSHKGRPREEFDAEVVGVLGGRLSTSPRVALAGWAALHGGLLEGPAASLAIGLTTFLLASSRSPRSWLRAGLGVALACGSTWRIANSKSNRNAAHRIVAAIAQFSDKGLG